MDIFLSCVSHKSGDSPCFTDLPDKRLQDKCASSECIAHWSDKVIFDWRSTRKESTPAVMLGVPHLKQCSGKTVAVSTTESRLGAILRPQY